MTIPDLYGQITAQDIPDADPALLRVLNRLQSSIQNGLVGGLSLSDNSKCDIINGVFTHGVATQIKLNKVKTPGAVQVLGADGHFPLSASVQAGGSGGANAVVYFANPLAKNVQATLLVTPEGTKTKSVADPTPPTNGSGANGTGSCSAISITAGGNTYVDITGLSCSYTPCSNTKSTLVTVFISGFAGGGAGGLQVRWSYGVTPGTTWNFYYNTMAQHQGWPFQTVVGNLGPAGTPITVKAQVISPTGSAASFNQDANDSCSIVVREVG